MKKKLMYVCTTASGAVLLLSQQAFAALPTEATAAFTSIGTMITDVIAATWVPVALVTVGFIGIKLFKRGGNKV